MCLTEVSISLNVDTFSQNALNSNFFVPNMSSTVILAKSPQNSAKSRKLAGIPRKSPESCEIRRTLFSDAMFPARFALL